MMVFETPIKPLIHEHRGKLIIAGLLILIISAIHYLSDPHNIAAHNIARRMYYLPIVISAFALGIRGGVFAAIIVTLIYFPHAFLMEHHHDPAPGIDKTLELVLYFVVGTITGFLVQKERKVRFDLQAASRRRDELQTQLIQASKLSALGELSSGLAHEIRNPLASILGSAEALSSEFNETHKKRRIADLLISEIGRLNGVVTRFLTFAKPNEPLRESVQISAIIDRALQLLPDPQRATLAGGNLDGVIWADQNQIQQVLLNVALNGLASAPEANICFKSDEQKIQDVGYYRISISDNGSGIDEGMKQTLFDPFITSRADGSGLGLTISKQIMEAHEGFIEFESSPDGSVFHLYFPKANL